MATTPKPIRIAIVLNGQEFICQAVILPFSLEGYPPLEIVWYGAAPEAPPGLPVRLLPDLHPEEFDLILDGQFLTAGLADFSPGRMDNLVTGPVAAVFMKEVRYFYRNMILLWQFAFPLIFVVFILLTRVGSNGPRAGGLLSLGQWLYPAAAGSLFPRGVGPFGGVDRWRASRAPLSPGVDLPVRQCPGGSDPRGGRDARHHRAEMARTGSCEGQGSRGNGQPHQERFPGQHEP